MKKGILTLAIISFIYAQRDHKEYFYNGKLRISGQYDKDENQTGEWRHYYDTGDLLQISNYSNGVMVGEWK